MREYYVIWAALVGVLLRWLWLATVSRVRLGSVGVWQVTMGHEYKPVLISC